MKTSIQILHSRKFREFEQGFTLVEMMIVVGITAVISGIFIANLKQGEIGRNLKIGADTTESGLRLMQNNILSGLPHPSGQPARDFGMTVTSAGTTYVTFAEEKNSSGAATNYQAIETVALPVFTTFTNIIIGGSSAGSITVRFMPPFGEIRISGGSYAEATNLQASFDILYTGTTRKKTVTIDGISGRIVAQ